jgi:hypothetical protein
MHWPAEAGTSFPSIEEVEEVADKYRSDRIQ